MSLVLVQHADAMDESNHELSVEDLVKLVQKNNNASRSAGPSRVNLKINGSPTTDQSETNSDSEDIDVQAFIKNNEKARKRKRKADKSCWKREKAKTKRMHGESYSGYQTKRDAASGRRVTQEGIPRKERIMGPPCRSKYCEIRNNYKCLEFTDEERKAIFDSFWTNMDWNQKKAFVTSLVDSVAVKRRSAASKGRRKDTLIYYLKLNERKVQVCRKMFLSTLALGNKQMLHWVKSSTCTQGPSTTSTEKPQARRKESTLLVSQFLENLPKLPSHYSRSSSSKLYLEPCINSKNQLYEIFKDYCITKGGSPSSKTQFCKIMEEKNIALFSPKKDQCDTCEKFNAGNLSKDEYDKHIFNKDQARKTKDMDKSSAFEGNCHIITMDLQAVKLAPLLKASALYFKTKLMVHNFTVYNLKTKDAVCYVWDETEGDLTASTFATCLVNYIKTYLPKDNLPLIIFSDGCTYQNRNVMMANALLNMAMVQNREIVQKYLEKGHTQMECDSVHSAIESELKNKAIYIPTDYIKIMEEARIKKPYIVNYLNHDFFLDYSLKKYHRYLSIRPGETKGDPCVTDLRNILYAPDGKISYKLSYENTDWKPLKGTPKSLGIIEYPKLYQGRIKIAARKYSDLQALKPVIPKEYHAFYDSLPHS